MRSKFRTTGRVLLTAVICLTMAAAHTVYASQDTEPVLIQDQQENLLVNPDWEDGLAGWEILADSQQEWFEDHDARHSIVYQDVPVTDYMTGKTFRLRGSIGLALEDPTQEAAILALEIRGTDGYVLDSQKDDGSFLYHEFVQERQQEQVFHEILMDVPEEAAFARVILEIVKEGRENSFNFSDLYLELIDREQYEENPFVRVTGSEDEDTGGFARSTQSGDTDVNPQPQPQPPPSTEGALPQPS